jgi:hypothetical protein
MKTLVLLWVATASFTNSHGAQEDIRYARSVEGCVVHLNNMVRSAGWKSRLDLEEGTLVCEKKYVSRERMGK